MNIVLLGPPGAGKGTQAERIEEARGLPHIASGDIFRALSREQSPLAAEVRSYMDRGKYVPDELTIELVLRRLQQPDAARGFVLDGFPRTQPQARALDDALERLGEKVDVALHITAPSDVLFDRLAGRLICPNPACGGIYNLKTKPPRNDMLCDLCDTPLERRSDEEVETIRTRLETYIRQTQPMLEYYRQHKCLIEIDGSQPMDVVDDAVEDALDQFAPRRVG